MANIYISPSGNDQNPGTKDAPVRTGHRVLELVKPGDFIFTKPIVIVCDEAPPEGVDVTIIGFKK